MDLKVSRIEKKCCKNTAFLLDELGTKFDEWWWHTDGLKLTIKGIFVFCNKITVKKIQLLLCEK